MKVTGIAHWLALFWAAFVEAISYQKI